MSRLLSQLEELDNIDDRPKMRRPWCNDRTCGAEDCSTCYGPGPVEDDEEEEGKT